MAKKLQLLRNKADALYASHELALTNLEAKLATASDGEPVLARYEEGEGDNKKTRTILGIGGTGGYEIFDNVGTSGDVDGKIAAAIEALDSSASQTAAAGNGQLALSVTETNGKITAISGSIAAETYDAYGAAAAAVAALDATPSQSAGADGLALSLTEVDGVVTAISGSIAANTYDAYGAATAAATAAVAALDAEETSTDGTNVQVKVTEVDGVVTAVNITTDNTVNANDIAAAINALDKSDSAVSGQFVTAVSEADGVITVSRDNLTDAVLAGYAADTTKTGAIANTDTLEQALNKLENKTAAITVSSADGTIDVTSPAGGGTDLAVNIDGTTIVKANDGTLSAGLELTKLNATEITALSDANVKEAYKLIYSTDTNRNAIGDVVKVYKDQTLKSASFANQILTLTYILADGTESAVNIDMSALIEEQEVENGIQTVDHKLSIKLDTTGDDTGEGKFLTVGTNGLKLDGVSDAIAAAVNALDATASQAAGTDGLALSVTEVDGKITAISGSIAANTYDAYGAATTAIEALDATPSQTAGTDGLALSLTQVDGVVTAISGSIAANTYDAYGAATAAATAAVAALDSSVAATAASGNVYSVLTGVTQADGVLTDKTEVTLAAVAKTGDAADLDGTFDCGTY